MNQPYQPYQRPQITRESVLEALQDHIGTARGVTAVQLVMEIRGRFDSERQTRALRKIIEQLRREGFHVCGHPSNGYYMAASDAELIATCNFLYDRAMTTLSQVAAMRRVSLPDLKGQLRINT